MRATVFFVYLLVTAQFAYSQTAPTPTGNTLSSPGGRYVFGQISTFRSDQYLLDAQTGRMWKLACIKGDGVSCEAAGLLPVIFLNENGNTIGFAPPATGRH
jgi:hypothetical protein